MPALTIILDGDGALADWQGRTMHHLGNGAAPIRVLAMTAVTERTLEGIIEPFLPDSLEHPAKWLACDIAKAIRTFRERKVA